MPQLTAYLSVPRCPHCSIANPNLILKDNFSTDNQHKTRPRHWGIYICGTCGGVVSAWASNINLPVQKVFPDIAEVSEDIPERPRTFLFQAQESLQSPAGSVMLSASAIDAMLKEKRFTEGTLYSRIEKAAEAHLITEEMSKWAHAVRLDANDQRHADENAPLPSTDDAKRCLDFALALAEFLFVLPSRVQRGLQPKG